MRKCIRNAVTVGAFSVGMLTGCAGTDPATEAIIGVTAATAIGGSLATTDIQQTYYIGIFDPQDQLPPQMYRIRVHGQSSLISTVQFASGWVPANLVDTLSSNIGINKQTGAATVSGADADQLADIVSGRKLIMFGPEGFREAPRDHRLVIVMGSSPENFFRAIDQTLGQVAETIDRQRGSELQGQLFTALLSLREERARLIDVQSDLRLMRDRAGRVVQ